MISACSDKMRTALFWGVCIPLRSAIAYYALTRDRPTLRLVATVIGGRWVAGLEKGHIGAFGGPAWWAGERHAHGILWLLYAGTGRGEWLSVDVVLGMANWVRNHIFSAQLSNYVLAQRT